MQSKFNDIDHRLKEAQQEIIILENLNKLLQKQIADLASYDVNSDITPQATLLREREQENILLKELLNIIGLEDIKQQKIIELILDEIRNPITPIRTYAELLYQKKFGKLTKQQKEKLQIILKYSARLEKILFNSLDLRAIEKNRVSLNIVECDIVELIQNAIKDIKKDRDISCSEIIIDDKVRTIYCDSLRIKYVLWNLLELGLPTIGVTSSIVIKTFQQKQQLVVEIHDLMINSTSKDMDDFWVKPTIKHRDLRSEIWELYVCQKIIEKHGGVLKLKKNNESMAIRFTLPLIPQNNSVEL